MWTIKQILAGIKALFIVVGCCGCCSLAAAESATAPATASANAYVYRIACDDNFPPLSFFHNGELMGLDVEILQAVAREAGFDYTLQALPFDVIVPRLVAGRLDGAIAGLSILENRKEILDFSDGYLSCGLAAVAREQDGISRLVDLKDKRGAVKKGTLSSLFAEVDGQNLNMQLHYYDSSDQMARAVMSGKADFYLEDYPVAAYMVNSGLYPGLELALPRVNGVHDYGFAVAKGKQQELLEKFNYGLHLIEKSGEYERLVKKYLGEKPQR